MAHGVKPLRLIMRPKRGLKRAAGENIALFGAVAETDLLILTGEYHFMVADHRAAAQSGNADIARTARAGYAVAATVFDIIQIDAARAGRRIGQ